MQVIVNLRLKLLLLIFIKLPLLITAQTDTLSIYFDFDKYAIKSYEKLKLTNFAIKNKGKIESIRLFGYTDYKGSDSYNKELSEKRVAAVYNYLINKGFRKNTITTKIGKGRLITNKNNPAFVYKDRKVDIIYKIKKQITDTKPLVTAKEAVKKEIHPKEEESRKSIDDVSDLAVGDKILLDNLYFIGGRHFIKKESKPVLKKLLKMLRKNPNLKIEIQGYICCQKSGDGEDLDTGLRNLSVARARYIYDYLINKGIEPNRLKYRGMGASNILPGTSYMDSKNRRVEIVILDK